MDTMGIHDLMPEEILLLIVGHVLYSWLFYVLLFIMSLFIAGYCWHVEYGAWELQSFPEGPHKLSLALWFARNQTLKHRNEFVKYCEVRNLPTQIQDFRLYFFLIHETSPPKPKKSGRISYGFWATPKDAPRWQQRGDNVTCGGHRMDLQRLQGATSELLWCRIFACAAPPGRCRGSYGTPFVVSAEQVPSDIWLWVNIN